MSGPEELEGPASAFESPSFGQDVSFHLDKPVGSASISPSGRDVVLASRQGLHIIDLDSPYSPPRHLPHHTPWEVADVQWSPFAARDYWVVSTSNQKALVWNLGMANNKSSVEHVLHAHSRAITDINFSAHNPDILSTCAVDSFVHCWDLRHPSRPAMTFCDWFAGATQVKWNRQDPHILASSHDKYLRIWDDRKGAYPLRSIEAHATKIYGVDWSRTETTNLATCSLDRTIKFWDYTRETNEPEHLIRVPFPVWRARHTPFGYGLLAMPQRADYDLHLYDRRLDEDTEHIASAIHRFDGHNDQVKEFLWRPRGSITETKDNREFQLVSWGTDRMLRLHNVSEEVLADVGYEKGMEIRRPVNFTRRNAVYKTFRKDPSNDTRYDQKGGFGDPGADGERPSVGMRSALTMGINRASIPFIGGYGNGGFMSAVATRKPSSSTDMDPISWMRGVKIGKRDTSPSGMHLSVSSILSPSLKTDPTWDVFESLGEEITHVGEKFAKVAFDEVDMQRRKIVVSLSGPWGPDKTSTYIKTRIGFPSTYPDATAPTVSLEKTASISEDVVNKVNSEVSKITASFLSRQRSSLEAILRYILGEQTLEEGLMWLKKRQESVDLDSTLGLDISSSDEDDEASEKYAGPQANDMESRDPMIAKPQAQNNPPLPKACGALWAANGLLVCFFPPKLEKEPSFLDLTLKASSSKNRKFIFEGFGRFYNAPRRKKQAPSTLETIESGDSDFNESSSSSSGSSSSSDGIGLARHHFMPGMGDASETFPGVSLDESQKSSSGMEKSKSTVSKGKNFVSIHDYSNLLPAKKSLAQNYIIGHGSYGYAHNAQVARETGDLDLAEVWVLVDLILQDKVPLEVVSNPRGLGSTQDLGNSHVETLLIIARRTTSKLRPTDSAIDLSYGKDEESLALNVRAPVKWGDHPFGRRYLVDALLRHFEGMADVQMVAMLSCAFDEHRGTSGPLAYTVEESIPPMRDNDIYYRCGTRNYYPSEEVANARSHPVSSDLSFQADYQNTNSGTHSANSSTGAPLSDLSASGTPPVNYRPVRTSFGRRESQATSLSTSPEHLRHTHRSNSNLSAFGASFSRPFSFSNSIASSPPHAFPKKRLSPVGSYLGTSTSASTWNPSHLFGRSSTITEDHKSSYAQSMSDREENISRGPNKLAFATILKNQDRFHNDGYAQTSFLDPDQQRYRHYREAYARLLYIWGLPIARAEVLKYNCASTAESAAQSASLLAIGKAGQIDTQSTTEDHYLGPRDHCTSCAVILPHKSTLRRCHDCSAIQAPVTCLLCNTFIQGLSSPCFNCGHILHASCRELLFSYAAEDVPSECISGCGCICADHTIISIEVPTTARDEARGIAHEEVSPAMTVIGNTAANEQEQLGWYDNSEWEDMAAYESLARNLQPRNEVKPKSSQVWRRRRSNIMG